MADIPGRSPSGVRLSGDEYQHLVTLNEALRAIRNGGVATLTVEAVDAGNVDDVVVHFDDGSTRYTQVKHAVDGRTPVGTGWLVEQARKGRKSLLQRFHESWAELGGAHRRPFLQLVTDRDIDPSDPILRVIDRRTGLVTPAVRATELSEAREVWASHVGVDDADLLTFLDDLHLFTGRSFDQEYEVASLQLETLGLNSGRQAMDAGLALVREWVQQRERTISVPQLAKLVEGRVGRRSAPGGLLIIEGIDDAHVSCDADVRLRFVDYYEGESPFGRRQLRDSQDWQRVVWPELKDAATQLRNAGFDRVIVGGQMRLAMWFGAGSALRHVLGFNIGIWQRGHLWSSDVTGTAPPIITNLQSVGSGTALAVAVSIASDLTTEVVPYVKADPHIAQLLQIEPEAGASNESVSDGPTAAALAEAIRNTIRGELDASIDHVHLFLATPAGVALLLGHRWNALRPTTVYEHLGTGRGYEPTFVVPA